MKWLLSVPTPGSSIGGTESLGFLAPIVVVLLVALTGYQVAKGADDPVAIEPSDDTYLTSKLLGKPAGRGERDDLQLYGSKDATFHRVLIKFDLRRLPPGFRSAVLQLTCWNAFYKSDQTSYIRCHPIIKSWNEGQVSWDMTTGAGKWKFPGGEWDVKAIGGCRFSGPMGGEKRRPFLIDLTSIARQWAAQPARNQGVVLMLEKGCGAQLRFRSKEHADADARPKLLLYYKKAADRNTLMIPGDKLPPLAPVDPAAPWITADRTQRTFMLGAEVQISFRATGGSAPYLFGPGSAMPPGLKISRDGKLTGTLKRAGTYSFGISCVDRANKRSTDWHVIEVFDPAKRPKEPPRKEPPSEKADDKKPAEIKDVPNEKKKKVVEEEE